MVHMQKPLLTYFYRANHLQLIYSFRAQDGLLHSLFNLWIIEIIEIIEIYNKIALI